MEARFSQEDTILLITCQDDHTIARLRMLSAKTKDALESIGVHTIYDYKKLDFSKLEALSLSQEEREAITGVYNVLVAA